MSDSSKVKLVHIFGKTPHHYVPMYTFFTSRCNGEYEQVFWAWQDDSGKSLDNFTYYRGGKHLVSMMQSLPQTARFVFHGMFDRSLWPALVSTNLPRRCAWICWGADLYQHREKSKGFKRKVMYWLHRYLTKSFKYVCSLNNGDGDLIRSLLWDRKVTTLPYPLIVGDIEVPVKQNNEPKMILVGNSANPTNRHIWILEQLAQFKCEHIDVVVPLNYAGPQEYIEEVIERGNALLGEKFRPITSLLDKSAYDKLLAETDVAVFAQERQQGLYVVYSMLKYGKKMYLLSATSSFTEMQLNGFTVHDSSVISTQSFSEFIAEDSAASQTNQHLMQDVFSQDALAPRWVQFFNALIAEAR